MPPRITIGEGAGRCGLVLIAATFSKVTGGSGMSNATMEGLIGIGLTASVRVISGSV